MRQNVKKHLSIRTDLTAPSSSSDINISNSIRIDSMAEQLIFDLLNEPDDVNVDDNDFDADEDGSGSEDAEASNNHKSEARILMEERVNAFIKTKSGRNIYEYCYRGFWMPRELPVMQGQTPTYNKYIMPRVFFWCPQWLPGGQIKCFKCKSECEGDGWQKSPLGRRVVDMNDCYYIVTSRYLCKNQKCATKFNGNHPMLLESLPYHIRNQFPAHLTKRSAIDLKVLEILRTTVTESFGMSQFRRMLIENHARKYTELRLQYLSRYVILKTNSGALGFNSITIAHFPEYRAGYGGFVPTTKYLTSCYVTLILKYEKSLAAQIAKVSGVILSFDHTYTVSFHLHVNPISKNL